MASNAQKKKRIDRKKTAKAGKDRKRLVRRNGTTPKFEIHPGKMGRKHVDVASLKIDETE